MSLSLNLALDCHNQVSEVKKGSGCLLDHRRMAFRGMDLDLVGMLMEKSDIIDSITGTVSGVNMFLETWMLAFFQRIVIFNVQ